MIIEGSKIELVKEMGPFTNVGEVCEVVKVTEDGVISFKFGNGLHLGCMSYAEYETYFKPYEEPVKVERVWTEWSESKILCLDRYGEYVDVIIKERDNGKKYQVKTYDFNNILTAEATCSPTDEFNIEDGRDLALARLRVKIAEYEAGELASTL